MSGKASDSSSTGGTSRCRCGRRPILLGVVGVLLLASSAWENRGAYWCPVRIPLAAETTETATFIPQAGVLYELEIEVNQPTTHTAWEEIFALVQMTNSPLDLTWEVSSSGETLISGDSREAAYVSSRTTGWRGRLKDALLFETFHRDSRSRRTFGLSGGGTISRGVGYFRSSAAVPHQVEVRTGTNHATFTGREPTFNVRRSRQEWLRHRRQVVPLIVIGYCSLAAAVALWMLQRWSRPASRAAGEGPQEGTA